MGDDQVILESHVRRLKGFQCEVEAIDGRITSKASMDEEVRR